MLDVTRSRGGVSVMRGGALLLSLLLHSDSSPAAPWARAAGGTSDDSFWRVALKPDGSPLVAGWTASVNSPFSQVWVLSYDSTGRLLWQRALGLGASERAYDMVVTSEGGSIIVADAFLPGAPTPDLWVVKLNPGGKTQWQRLIGGAGWEMADRVIQTSGGGYLLAGTSTSVGQGSFDGWLVRLDERGEILWQKTYGGSDTDMLGSLVEMPHGTLLAGGYTRSFGAGGADMWLLSLTSSGDVIWSRTYGGKKNDWMSRILVHSNGDMTLVGSVVGDENWVGDAAVVRTGPNGSLKWTKRYGGSAADGFSDILPTANGHYVVVGTTASYGHGLSDGWAMEIDDFGRASWQRTYGGAQEDRCYGLVALPNTDFMMWGTTQSFGAGGYDGWLVGMELDGTSPADCASLSEAITCKARNFPLGVRRPSMSTLPAEIAVTQEAMSNRKPTLPSGDLCGSQRSLGFSLATGPLGSPRSFVRH